MSMNTAQAVVRGLLAHGIDTLYCLPGVQNDPFFDALFDHTGKLRPVHTRHEQGAAYMALGAALATGKPQAFCVVPGPGFLNASAALATAYSSNAPVLALVGQIASGMIGRGAGQLHEITDQLGVMKTLTKWAVRVEAPAKASGAIAEAFRQMASLRPRPAGLEVPMDIWAKDGAEEPRPLAPLGDPAIDEDAILAAAKLLGAAQRPLIFVGGGAREATQEVRALAEMLSAPVASYRNGQGVLDARHPLCANLPIAHRLWKDADVVLGVGTRLQLPQQIWGTDDALKVVRVDIDPDEHARLKAPTVAITARAAPALRRLLDVLPAHNARRDRLEEISLLKAEIQKSVSETLAPQVAYLDAIRAELPEDGILVEELTQVGYVSRIAFPVYRPRTFLSSGFQGTLGWGYAAALGAKVACPGVPVVSISGDGGFMFNVQELATAVRHKIPLVAIVFSDDAYGNVRMFQQQHFKGRVIAADLANPDFVKLAESFGVAGMRARTPGELRGSLKKAFSMNAPVLIEVPCGDMPSPWSFIQMPKVRG